MRLHLAMLIGALSIAPALLVVQTSGQVAAPQPQQDVPWAYPESSACARHHSSGARRGASA